MAPVDHERTGVAMEPIDYLRILRRRWLLILALVFLGAAGGFITAPASTKAITLPSSSVPATLFAGTNVLIPQPFGAPSGAPSLSTVSLFVKAPDVAKLAAADVHYSGDPQALAARVQVAASTTSGTLSLTVTDYNGAFAASTANAFANRLQQYVTQLAQTSQQQTAAAENSTLQTIQGQINTLNAQLPADSKTPITGNLVIVKAQRDSLVTLYGQDFSRYQALLAAPLPASPLVSVQTATPVPAGEDPALFTPTTSKSSKAPGTTATTIAPATSFVAPRPAQHHSKTERSGLGGLAGLVLGIGLALVLEPVDTRLRTREAVEDAFAFPVLAEVALVPTHHGATTETRAFTQPSSPLADSYRSLRTALMLGPELNPSDAAPAVRSTSVGDHPTSRSSDRSTLGVLVVTSPWTGEGKTSTVANLAASLAEARRSVAVVSGDFRRPLVHRYLGTDEAPGLSDLLASQDWAELPAMLQPSIVPNVQVLASGTPVENEVAMLATAGRVGAELRERADAVLIDTPGLLVGSDASEFLSEADGVVLVCRLGMTTRDQARRAASTLRRLGAPVVGVVLIGTTVRARNLAWLRRKDHNARAVRAPQMPGAAAQHPVPPKELAAGQAEPGAEVAPPNVEPEVATVLAMPHETVSSDDPPPWASTTRTPSTHIDGIGGDTDAASSPPPWAVTDPDEVPSNTHDATMSPPPWAVTDPDEVPSNTADSSSSPPPWVGHSPVVTPDAGGSRQDVGKGSRDESAHGTALVEPAATVSQPGPETDTSGRTWVRDPAALSRVTSVGVVILPSDGSESISLVGSGVALWEALDAPRTLAEIAERLSASFDAPRERIANDVQPTLDALVVRGVVSCPDG